MCGGGGGGLEGNRQRFFSPESVRIHHSQLVLETTLCVALIQIKQWTKLESHPSFH